MIVAISALVVLVERGMALWSHFKPSPPAGELSLVAAQLAQRIEDLEAQRLQDLNTASERRQKIYAELAKQRTEWQGEIKDVYRRIEKESDKVTLALHQLPGEIVVMLNDDYTPMEFVVVVLQEYFNRDLEAATQIMLKIHHDGRGVCGIYSKDVAATKVELVLAAARRGGHPLQCIMEAA